MTTRFSPYRPYCALWPAAIFVACLSLTLATVSSAQQGVRDGEWPHYGGDLGSTKYAALDQIDRNNVEDLEIAWRWDSPDNELAAGNRRLMPYSYKSTPIMLDRVLYVSTSLGLVAALDAANGEQIWQFDTKTYEDGRPLNLGFNHRGVAYWTDGGETKQDKRVFMPTNNAYLFAIDADTGKAIESFGDGGRVDLTKGLRREVPRRLYMVVAAPLVVGDVVIVGSSIFDGPTHKLMPPGDVRGFDVRTGEQLWTFHSVAQPGEVGHETWEDGSWEYTGNTNVWSLMSADAELGYVYLPFGTPTNDWYGGHRLGDNLFAESLVCVRASTGKLVWYYQLVHHGLWDYDIPAAPTLLDVTIDGKPVKAVAQLTKQGFLFVFDRVTGEPVWPIEERPVPRSDIPGERASPTQPFPTKPAPFEYQGISHDVLIDFTPELRAEAIEMLDDYVWGPLYTPPSLKGTLQLPGWGGGANWSGGAIDPETGRIFFPSATWPIRVGLTEPDAARSDFRYTRDGNGNVSGPRGLPLIKPPYGRITAIDLSTGERAWMVPHGDGPRQQVIDLGIPDPGPLGSGSATGPVLTKTLMFIAQGGRTSRNRAEATVSVLRAFDPDSGEVVGAIELPLPASGTPVTYMANGRQFIVLAGGGMTEAGLMALALPEARQETPSGSARP